MFSSMKEALLYPPVALPLMADPPWFVFRLVLGHFPVVEPEYFGIAGSTFEHGNPVVGKDATEPEA